MPPVNEYYAAGSADRRARKRKQNAGKRPLLKNNFIRSYVVRHLRAHWTPEQISGILHRRHPGQTVCPETIYQFVYDFQTREQLNLIPYLVRGHKRRVIRGHRHTHRTSHIPERISIEQRSELANSRRQFGHWESDTVISRNSVAALCVMVERKARYTKLFRIKQKTARRVRTAITRSLSHYPTRARRSITYDNGAENVEHTKVNTVLNTRSFFCQPFHSWEKGTVENTVGIIRRTFPKKTNFDRISDLQIRQLERRLNNRPRKILNYKTPREVFNRSVALAR
jgi:IS30 family transposase